MGSNPPITAVPFSLAQPKVHIARYLDSVRPFARQHADRGALYFRRSRRGGDHLSEEDVNPDYEPPEVAFSALLESLSSYPSTSQLSDFAAKGSLLLADSLRPRLRDNTKTVDHERGKHVLGRGPSAQRISPYPMRSAVKVGEATGSGDHYAGLGLRHQPQPQQQRYSPDLGLHNRALLPDGSAAAVGPFGIEYEAAHPRGLSPRKGGVQSPAVPRSSPKRLAPLDVSRSVLHQDVVQAAPARLNIARPGIFARGVTSQPIKVAGSPQQASTGQPAYQLDERLLHGLTSNRAQQPAPPPLSTAQPAPPSHSSLRMGSSAPWPLPRPYPTQQQTPPGTASLPLEDPTLLDAMLPFYTSRGRGDTLYQLQTPPSALASFLPTDLTNVVSPIEPSSSPFEAFEGMHSNVPQASEQRAVSADPPRWDSSAEALDWGRPVSAPPSKLAPTPPNEAAHGRLPTRTYEPGHRDLITGFGDPAPIVGGGGGGGGGGFAFASLPPAKPPVDSAFVFRPNDYDFDLKQWSPFPDAPNWDMHHPAPYTYGYSPQAHPDPATSLLPTSGPSGSSPFPSFHDAYTPQDSPRDELPVPPAFAGQAYF